ncbi:SKI/DACH domain-containing protein 1 [Gadus morhua]|uniref:SKI/DACH domain containing 1 n=1 Tax=Gadus morhua TaxID=8049 RepID=A0A8C4ZUP7_GADMO|nr:SKI/DACH domain-containing protein 1 [Gadus morhua]
MGDLECGFEEMQGVKLGYLVIKGKQMFALSQVFTDLLKNIPRTTVHKRMDHLNVKKHQCGLEELRKLKAINSIAFHAAKCTLISREDVEALYFSCKTERVLKSNKRKVKDHSLEDANAGILRTENPAGLWQDKLWFSLHGVPQTLSIQNKPDSTETTPSLPDSKLPQFYSRSPGRNTHAASKSSYKPYTNYETAQITGNCLAFNKRKTFFRGGAVVQSRAPVVFQSAMAAQSKLSGSAGSSDLLHKRKRRREGGGGKDGARHSCTRTRHIHHSPVLLVQPKCCGKQKPGGTRTLNAFHIGHDFYLDSRGAHGQQHQPLFHESYSSDTESSTYSERANVDSDFGSSISTTSNSGSSDDEEEEEDDSQSESSDGSSEEESSSQSDSSSVSSQVSVQSIRFRRARVASVTKTFSTKAPLVLQPTFHYIQQQKQQQTPPPQQHRTLGHCFGADYIGHDTRPSSELAFKETRRCSGPLHPAKFNVTAVRDNFLTVSKSGKGPEAHGPKRADLVCIAFNTTPSLTCYQQFPPPRRTNGFSNTCPATVTHSHCEFEKDSKLLHSKDAELLSLRNELENTNNLKQPSPFKTIKTETEEPPFSTGLHSDQEQSAKGPPSFNFQNVKVKVEESYDEYEYPSQASEFQCKGDVADDNNAHPPVGDVKHVEYLNNTTKAYSESTDSAPKSPYRTEECRAPLRDTPCSEEGEYEHGQRVRKICRTPLLGKKHKIPRTQTRQNLSKHFKASPPRPTDKEDNSDGPTEDSSGISKIKRQIVKPPKKPFSFMANFPSTPSLVVGRDGDLCPAYSMQSLRDPRPPPLSHPVWRWQPGGLPLPPPPAQRTRKC